MSQSFLTLMQCDCLHHPVTRLQCRYPPVIAVFSLPHFQLRAFMHRPTSAETNRFVDLVISCYAELIQLRLSSMAFSAATAVLREQTSTEITSRDAEIALRDAEIALRDAKIAALIEQEINCLKFAPSQVLVNV